MLILVIILCFLIVFLIGLLLYRYENIQTDPPESFLEEYHVENQKYKGKKIFIITPKEGPRGKQTIFYLHGGAYVAELYKYHWEFFRNLLKDLKCTLIVPDYPLAPKYQYDDVFNRIIPIYEEILKRIEPEDLILMGDSAGGGISLALLERMGEQNGKQPGKTILISPWLDVTLKNPKINEVQKWDPVLDKKALKLAGISYAGKYGMQNYLVNPINGPLDKLKNVTIFTGTYDILNPDVHELQKKAEQIGTTISVKEFEEAIHIWILNRYVEPGTYLGREGYEELLKVIQEE